MIAKILDILLSTCMCCVFIFFFKVRAKRFGCSKSNHTACRPFSFSKWHTFYLYFSSLFFFTFSAFPVFQVTIDMLCDPDYINQKILSYIKQQEKLMADTKRTYTYAASYEDFVKMINVSSCLDELKQMR